MSGQQQIEAGALAEYGSECRALHHFIKGAEWADEHPHRVSVDDELPEENKWVLTYNGSSINLLMLAGNANWYDHSVAIHRDITYWMPLPEPPEHLAGVNKKKTACPDCIVAEFPGCNLGIPCCKCDEQCNSRQPCPKKGEEEPAQGSIGKEVSDDT